MNAPIENLCGIYITPQGIAEICTAKPDGSRAYGKAGFAPFLWVNANDAINLQNAKMRPLQGPVNSYLDTQASFDNIRHYEAFLKDNKYSSFRLANLENQFLTENCARFFSGMKFSQLRRMQLDIETDCTGDFSNPENPLDRVLAIGISCNGKTKILELSEFSDNAERKLLSDLNDAFAEFDPDVIEGHNIFKFDLDYLYKRCKILKVKPLWGRFDGSVKMRKSRVSIAERTFDFPRFDIAGRSIADTYILLQMFDVSKRELESYSLKNAALYFGISKESQRTYIEGAHIKDAFRTDKESFRKYLLDDLRETKGLADLLLPTYFAQCANFPMTFQECMLRGSGVKVEALLLEKYYSASAKLPDMAQQSYISGAMSEIFEKGVFKDVLHYDIASLYPSLLLSLNTPPANDYLNVFLTSLAELRQYRLKYKKLAKESSDKDLKTEYDARQKSYKILINSFYGYLGLSSARFGDCALADKITSTGRRLLGDLIALFKAKGCLILEVDTDGIYLSSREYFANPEKLLESSRNVLPEGVSLEHDGSFGAMFCYKAKNYALLDSQSGKISVKGSALKSRAMEPFLRMLTNDFVSIMLGAKKGDMKAIIADISEKIKSGTCDISLLAKSEYLTGSLANYLKEVQTNKKPKRAAYQAALMLVPLPHTGEKVSYYITESQKRQPDWKNARPVELYDAKNYPYSKSYYLDKLNDWIKRYSEFLGGLKPENCAPEQMELF